MCISGKISLQAHWLLLNAESCVLCSVLQLNYYSAEAEFAVEKVVFRKAHFAASNIVSEAQTPHE